MRLHAFHEWSEGRRKAVSPLLSIIMKKLLIVILAFLLGAVAFAEEKRYDVPIGDSPSIGPSDAPATIIEFIDFQ